MIKTFPPGKKIIKKIKTTLIEFLLTDKKVGINDFLYEYLPKKLGKLKLK